MEGRHASDTLPTYCLLTLLRGLDLTHHTQSRRPGSSSPRSDARFQMPGSRCQDPNPRTPPGPRAKKATRHPSLLPTPTILKILPSPVGPLPRTQDSGPSNTCFVPTSPSCQLTKPHCTPPAAMSSGRLKTEGTTETNTQSLSHAGARSRAPRQVKGPWKAKETFRARTGMYLDRSRPGTTGTFRAGLAIELDRESRTPSASGRGILARETGYSDIPSVVDS
jgi:hypothetical protein